MKNIVPPAYKRIQKTLSPNSKKEERKRRARAASAKFRRKCQKSPAPAQAQEVIQDLTARVGQLENQLALTANVVEKLANRLATLEKSRQGPGCPDIKITPFDLRRVGNLFGSAQV